MQEHNYPRVISESRQLSYKDLPPKHQRTAQQWAVDAWNEIYREQGIAEIDESAPEVRDYVMEHKYVIQTIQFTRRIQLEELQYGE